MKSKYGIGLFVVLFIILYLSFNTVYNYADENAKTKIENPASVEADGTVLKENCYYLYEVNGYVVVFLSDKKTPYEYTDIVYEELPELLRTEIKNGKYIEGTEELYGFLENYSS